MKKAFLFLLGLLAVVGIQAQTSPYAGNEVAAGDFFLYNVESGLWLQNNDGRNTGDWNTRGAVGSYGFEFGISVEGAGWKLDPKFGHNHSMNSSNFYLDTGDDVTVWTIEPKTVDGVTNAYTIKAGDQILGLDENENIAWTDVKSTWQLVTRADRLAYLKANASAENPIDATFLIMDPGFTNENERGGAWKWEQDGGNRDDVRPIRCRRSYAIWNSNSFKISQQIADIPNGSYKLTVKGYYRDGDRDQVVARRNEGNERILANYFLNSDKAPFMSILDGASDEWMDGTFYYPGANDDAPYGHYPDNADAFSRIFQNYPNAYQNAGVVSVVTTKSMTIGIEKLEKNDRDWLAWDDFRLIYMGSNIDIAAMQEALQKAINQAKEWDASNTSTVLATALNTVISESEAKLTSTDEDELSAATAAVNEALSKAQALNVSTLKQFIAFGQKFGADVTEANNAVENAQTADEVNVALLNLQGAIKVKAQTVADIYTGVAPAAGEFYLFNVGTGMWLNQGSDWCTHAAVDQAGLLITFEESGAGFVFHTPWGTFNNSPYTDTPVTTVYTFQAVDGKDGVYNILEGNRLLGWNPQGHTDGEKYWSSISNTEGADPADPNFQWKVVSKAERDELLAKATKAAPVDATYLINNPSLQRQPGYNVWAKEVDGGNGGARVDNKGGDRSPDFAWEYYDTNSFKFYQELEGLTPGLYEVSATAFYRDGNGGYQAGVVNDGGELLQLAYLFGNDAQTPLPNIASVTDFVPGVATQASSKGSFPNWPREAIEYFEYGAYKVTVKAVVGEDGKLAIGIAKDSKANDGDWVVFDNFRLAYLGNDETDIAYERAVAAIKDGQTYRVFTEVNGNKFYLNTAGYLVNDTQKAATFTFKKITSGNTLYETGWNLGCKFTNPSLTNGQSGDVVQNGHIIVGGNDRNDWERQVFFLNAEGKYAVRATNANSANWGANTFWTVTDTEAELPKADYALTSNYVWQIEENVDNRPEAFDIASSWVTDIQAAAGLVTAEGQWSSNAKESTEGSFAALTDGEYTSFFHSQWSGTGPAEDHYLQAELPDAAQEFYFYFKKRSQNNNNRPTTIVISGSNDGQNFTEITTITEGLPTDNGVLDYLSAKVAANEAYKYIRFTVPSTNSGNANNGHVFFTFSEFYILPSDELIDKARAYMDLNDYTDLTEDDVPIIKQIDADLKAAFSTVKVTYALYDVNGAEPVQTKTVVVEANSEVQVPSSFTGMDYNGGFAPRAYYDYSVEGTIGDTNCTIKVVRTPANGVVHALTDLSNDKTYLIRCDRGALLTVNETIGSTSHAQLHEVDPAEFAIISYENNYYLYSVADKKFVQNNGALAEMPTNGVFDAIQMGAQTDPYFLFTFKIDDATTYGLNTNGTGALNGCVINNWVTPDQGDQYYMIEAAEFDPTAALAALDAYFNPTHFVTYVVKDAEGTTLFTSDAVPAIAGSTITTLPAEYQRAFTTYNEVEVPVTEEQTTVEFTATSTFPFEISASFDEAKWYNMTIRSDYYVAKDETEPYYPKADKDLDAPESQWAFAGDAYNGIVVMNKAAGEGWSLTKDGNNVVMREGNYAWTIGANADGFTLREIGTDNNCINQNGGNTGPLQFWNSAGSLTDNGSTFRVTEVVVPEPVILNAPTWSVADGTQAEPNMLSAATPLLITYTADNVEENGYNPDDLKVKVTVLVSGDLPENIMTMGSQTAHRVQLESFYIPLGEAEFPVALKLGYVYQNIVVTAAQLVANAETDAEEVIASYAGAPVQLHWIGKEEISMAQEMTITSTVGSFYEGLSADAPMADILLALGAESLEGVEIFALLPDDTRDPNYQLGTTDGWRDAEGNWKAWADGPDFFIKANFELPSGQIYEAGGYPDKTNEEKTFTAKYVFVKGEAEVTLTVNLVYEPAPTVDIDFSDLAVQGEPIVIEKTSPVGSSYEGFTADVDIASILSTLGVQSLDDVDIFAVQSDESLDPNYGVGTTDGWRNADGDWQGWGADARICVKADFTTASEQIYYIGGMNGQTSASGSYSAIFAFVKKNSETHEAVVLQVKLTYTASDAQMALEEEIANAEGLIEKSQNAELYDQDNAALADAVATLNDAIDAAKAKLGTTDDEMIAATNALKEAEDAFKSVLTAINGINADQLNGTIYDLGGRKIQKVQRGGVYIVNGKKVAVK